MSPEWIGPVLLLWVTMDSAVLEICRLTVCRHTDWICTITGVMWRAVGNHIRAVAAGGPEVIMLVVVLES